MTDVGWISLAGFVLTAMIVIVGVTLGVRRFSDQVAEKFDAKIDAMKTEFTQMEMVYERRSAQIESGLRVKINEVELYIRDHYVDNKIFERMIDMATANNENQFRALTEAMHRLNDKLDALVGLKPHPSGH